MSDGKKKDKAINFIITTSDPSDGTDAANKKRVRSVAASKSWRERREKKNQETQEATKAGQSTFSIENPDTAKSKRKQSSKISPVAGPKDFPHGIPSPPPAGTPEEPSKALQVQSSQTSGHASSSTELVIGITTPETQCFCKTCPRCRVRRKPDPLPLDVASRSTSAVLPLQRKRMADGSEKSFSFTGDLAMLTPPATPGPSPSNGQADPFNCYPVPFQPWFDSILHHMLTIYAPRGWPALKITNAQGLHWEWFMTQNALADPALFYVRLLYGSGDMIRLGTVKPEIQYWLRAQAIKAINEALADPTRATSDPLILAVGRIALHEVMYGDKQAGIAIHRPAQKRMIELRGGMKVLEFPELVKRLMRWADNVMAMRSGTARLLEDDVQRTNFTLRESVEVLETWVPREGASLRRQIKISDLINDDDAA